LFWDFSARKRKGRLAVGTALTVLTCLFV
jgi:hypothetical protein